MRDRRKQRIADPLGFGRRTGCDHLARRDARSSAAAVCSASVSSRALASESRVLPPSAATPMTPIGPRAVNRGTKDHGTIGNVPVSAPAGSLCEKAQRAAVMAAGSSASSGGQAAVSADRRPGPATRPSAVPGSH